MVPETTEVKIGPVVPARDATAHWSESPRWRTFAYLAGLFPFCLLFLISTTFYVDWTNHVWMVSYTGEFFRHHGWFPITFNTDRFAGMPYPVFYGFLFYPAAGVLAALTGGNLALRLICLLVAIFQLRQVRNTMEVLTGNLFLASAVAVVCSFATYPLTNLYNRAAVPEFIATSLIFSVTMMCVRVPYLTDQRARNLLILRAALVFAMAAGTHPITAVFGSLAIGLISLAIVRRELLKQSWKAVAGGIVLIAVAISPWLYALKQFNGQLLINESTGPVNVFSRDVDSVRSRLALLPTDPRKNVVKVEDWSTPYLDAQVNVPLLLFAGFLLIDGLRRDSLRSRSGLLAAVSLALAVFGIYASVSAAFWNAIPQPLRFIQFSYRMVTYVDLAVLVAIAFLFAARRPTISKQLITSVSFVMLLGFGAASVKLSHAAYVQNWGVPPGSEFVPGHRAELVRLPSTFYGWSMYAIRHSVGGEGIPAANAPFEVQTGSDFGFLSPVKVPAGAKSVGTNVQVFPWNVVEVNGTAVPSDRLRYDAEFRTVVPLDGQSATLTYKVQPDPMWRGLRLLSLWSVVFFAAAMVRVRPREWQTAIARIREASQALPAAEGVTSVVLLPRRTRWAIHAGVTALLVVIMRFEFVMFLQSRIFGAEFAQFYHFMHAKPFAWVKFHYRFFTAVWYRPTQFYLPYWIGDKLVSWHDPGGWRILELVTVLAVCLLIYWLVLTLLPGRYMAAFWAAVYFTTVPSIFPPVFGLGSFDFFHIIFTLLTMVAYVKGFRGTTIHRIAWTTGAWLAHVAALTSKEIVIVTPAYLALVSGVFIWHYCRPNERIRRAGMEAVRLVPFAVMPVIYWAVHLRKLPPIFSDQGGYRVAFNIEAVLQNIVKYPLWLSRIYKHTGDTQNQANGYDVWRNDIIGACLLVVVIYTWVKLVPRTQEYRMFGILALLWIGVFLAVPVYAGGFLWHGNLALAGFAMLVGVTADRLAGFIRNWRVRAAVMALVLICAVEVVRIDVAGGIARGFESESYRINSRVIDEPPVPHGTIRGPALVYVEDRNSLGEWFFSSSWLFPLVYENEEIKQVVVPTMPAITRDVRNRWLEHSNAYYFWYDEKYKWHDGTEKFRAFATAHQMDDTVPPRITKVTPPGTRAGAGFNVQPDGSSAVAVYGDGFNEGSVILFDGKPLGTVVASSSWLTAAVPAAAIAHPKDIRIQVRKGGGALSDPVIFHISP